MERELREFRQNKERAETTSGLGRTDFWGADGTPLGEEPFINLSVSSDAVERDRYIATSTSLAFVETFI